MVKPPRRMEPEAVELSKAGRSSSKAFQEDSFAKYIARKIDGQRKDKGCVLPPDPLAQQNAADTHQSTLSMGKLKTVRFASDVLVKERPSSLRKRRRTEVGMQTLVQRLKDHHGHGYSERSKTDSEGEEDSRPTFCPQSHSESVTAAAAVVTTPDATAITAMRTSPLTQQLTDRRDLFFLGVVVLVNGYTNPDTETLHRILHRHGGDLEKYETSRITHIIAENLSTAKANVYKQRLQPIPVCKPSWIMDSVAARQLLPYRKYLLEGIRKDDCTARPISSYFSMQTASGESGGVRETSDDRILPVEGPPPPPRFVETVVPTKERTTNYGATSSGAMPAESPTANHTNLRSNLGDEDKVHAEDFPSVSSPTDSANKGRTDEKYINGRVRTIGTDPNFLDSFFSSSRLSFIGSYKQRVKSSPTKKVSGSMRNKRRYVMHIDMDSFFCSVVLRSFPQYKNQPVAISHHGRRKSDEIQMETAISKDSTSECATCNYEARKYGVTKGMYLGRAKELCPDLVVLHYDFEGFEEVSEQVAAILDRHAGEYGGTLEQVSCDESYLELFLGDDQRQLVEDIGRDIRSEIYETTQCTATVGIGPNKLMAKAATDKAKPDGLMYAADYRVLLRDLRLRDLHGVGYRMEQKLAAEGLDSVQDVWTCSKDVLARALGRATGTKVYDLCHGKDDRPVEPGDRKSIGAECNYGVRFNGPYGPDHALDCLAKEVSKRMTIVGVKGSKVTLKVKKRKENAPPPPKFLGHGSCHNLSKSREAPKGAPTRDHILIRDICIVLFSEMDVIKQDVRGIGIVITKLAKDSEPNYVPPESNGGMQRFLRGGIARKEEATSPVLDHLTDAIDRAGQQMGEATEADCSAASLPFVIRDSPQQIVDDFAIEIPSLSQIRMSQVECLPSPMRRQAVRKVQDAVGAKGRQNLIRSRVTNGTESRLKQTDVKRLFTLAAVKTGEAPLHGQVGKSVSLHDLESLPLEMQLQLANDDTCSIGFTSKRRGSSKPIGVGRDTKRSISVSSPSAVLDDQLCDKDEVDAAPLIDRRNPDSFFDENLLPFNTFLDETPPDEASLPCVLQYLGICVSEHRVHEVTILLRSVKNRNDSWSTVFEQLFQEVDSIVFRETRRRLDKAWIYNS